MKRIFFVWGCFLFFMGCNKPVKKSESKKWSPKILENFKKDANKSMLPDFSFAGYKYGEETIPSGKDLPSYRVTDFGAIPNDAIDDTYAIQKTIDSAGANGGGVIVFPKGKFLVNTDTLKQDIIRINYSNIILRGAGNDANGTIIFSGSETQTHHKPKNPWLAPCVFHTGLNLNDMTKLYSVDEAPLYAKITADLKKGDTVVQLEKTVGLEAGGFIIMAMRNTNDESNLINELMQPLTFEPFQTSYLEAGKNRMPSFQWIVEIDKVIDSTRIKLKRPVQRAILTKYEAFVAKTKMLTNIGFENFRFESAYKGDYGHHKSKIHDYGWGAIGMHRVAHGWINNLTIDNYTQTTHLITSRNITVNNITITGGDGHYGPKMYNSSDNYIGNIKILAPRTHGPGIEGASFGNVFKDIYIENPMPLDLHGMANTPFCPPMYNLFENITNLDRVAGGGAPANIPHAGEYNTFWNLEISGYEEEGYNEIFSSWIWKNPKAFKNEFHYDCHKQYLRSIVVGVRHSKNVLTIEHSAEDRHDDYIYVEGLNSKRALVSLYDTQLKLRLGN